jgi:hypothetical protein
MKVGFRPVLQIMITKWNLALCSKSVSQRLQEVIHNRPASLFHKHKDPVSLRVKRNEKIPGSS